MSALTIRDLFYKHLAQTSASPVSLEIVSAKSCWITDVKNKKYLDFISGISVSNLGHGNKDVLRAVHEQVDKHLHLMVYGEYVLQPQVELARELCEALGEPFESVYLVNSGSEAVEGALKLAKRATGRPKVFAFKNAYHGSSHGALSLMGNEDFKRAFRPLLPGVFHLDFNDRNGLHRLDTQTAAVVVEVVQGEAGYVPGNPRFLQELRKKCVDLGIVLIADEIQTGFGRTGNFFAFQDVPDFVPDVVCMAKGMGAGMPIGGFAASRSLMSVLTNDPVLGHITTFGGHPVSAAAALAGLRQLKKEPWMGEAKEKEALLRHRLVHPAIRNISGAGLMLALQLENFAQVQIVIDHCLEEGLLVDWFLFNESAVRLAPPLIVSTDELNLACDILLAGLDLLVQ